MTASSTLAGKTACVMCPRTAKNLGQVTLPGAAFGDASAEKCWSTVPNTSHACKAVMMKNLIDPGVTNVRLLVEKLHVNWGRASAWQLKRIVTDSDGMGTSASKAAALERAPHLPVAGTSLASAVNEKVQADLLFSG